MTNYIINPEEIIGTTIPNVYISRITLEGGGFTQSRFQDNPHIDPNPNSEITEGGRTYTDELNVTLQLTLKDATSNNLSKWFSGGEIEAFDSNEDRKTLKDYIKVVVIRSTTTEATQAWSNVAADPSKFHRTLLRPLIVGPRGTSKYEFFLSELDGSKDLERHYQEYDSAGNSVRNISKNVMSSSDWEMQNEDHPPRLSTNPQHLAYFAWCQFDIETFVNEYKIDGIENMRDRMGLRNFGSIIGSIKSDIVFKNGELVKNSSFFVIGRREILGTTAKVIPTDHIWAGPTHRSHPERNYGTAQNPIYYDGWIGGTEFSMLGRTPFLVRKTVSNTKIQDFRIAKRINKLNIDLSNLENKVLRLVDKNQQSVIKGIKFSYFTEISLSRDKDNNCRFFFGIDLRKMVRENSIYSKLFSKNSRWLNEIMNDVRIVSMRIFRKRVQGSSELSGSPFHFANKHEFDPIHRLKKFSSGVSRESRRIGVNDAADGIATSALPQSDSASPLQEIRQRRKIISYDPSDELIIDAVELPVPTGGYTLIADSNTTDGKSAIKKFGNIYAESISPGIHYYTGVDGRMSEITDGFYQYRIELEILDNSISFLETHRQDLSDLEASFEEYFQLASAPGINGIKDLSRGDPHTTTINNYASRQAHEANFDPTTNRFTQSFINSVSTQQWKNLNFAQKYVNILKIFVELSDENELVIKDALNVYISPQTGNLQGCLLFLELLHKLMSVMERAIGVQKGHAKDKDSTGTNATGQTSTILESNIEKAGSAKPKTFKMKHTFSSYYNGNLPKNVGLDFLGTGLNDIPTVPTNVGLRVITSNTFQNTIVPKEIKKIFKDTGSSIQLRGVQARGITGINPSLETTSFSYFTPAIIKTPTRDIAVVPNGDSPAPDNDASDFADCAVIADTFNASYVTNVFNGTVNQDPPDDPDPADDDNQDTTSRWESGGFGEIFSFLSYNFNLTVDSINPPTNPPVPPGDTNSSAPSTLSEIECGQSSDNQTVPERKAVGVFRDLLFNGWLFANSPPKPGKKSIVFYNANNPNGFMKARDRLDAIHITNLPNQIKALIEFNDQEVASLEGGENHLSPLNRNIENLLASEPFTTPKLRSKVRFLFETIGEIEVFTGFENVEYGQEEGKLALSQMVERNSYLPGNIEPEGVLTIESSTARPVWTRLTRSIYSKAQTASQYLLCRIRRWENFIFKVQKEDGQELPIYEEYFLLEAGTTPSNVRLEQSLPVGAKTATIASDINPSAEYITSNPVSAGSSGGSSARSSGGSSGGGTNNMGGGY